MAQMNRVPIPGSDKHPVANAEEVGEIHPDERVEVTVQLRSRAEADLAERVQALAGNPPGGGEYLSREVVAERYGADPAQLAQVESFARDHGLTIVGASAARRSVILAGSASQVTAAFGVQLAEYAHPDGGSYRGRQGPIYVPADLASVVQGVFGLDNRPAAKPHIRFLTDGDQGFASA